MSISNSYEEKVVKQKPFIYKINEDYYAIGSGVCVKVLAKHISVSGLYNDYLECMNDGTDIMRAQKVFRKLMFIALNVRDEIGPDSNALNTLKSLEFCMGEDEKTQLKKGIKDYKEFIKQYNLVELLSSEYV